jgi:UDP-N-acetylmuramoyl-L-alanyl-D-glutamate--2,6-diaminopimelate ligase
MRLEEVLQGIRPNKLWGEPRTEIRGVVYSSLKVRNADLFVAIKGHITDGNRFVPQALDKGASAILSEEPRPEGASFTWVQVADAREALALCADNIYGHPSRALTVVGITGTKGKTTITYILESILTAAGFSSGIFGTINYRGPGLEPSSGRTTPESSDLQALMRTILDHGGTHCVLEVSSHALELKRVAGIAFDAAVFTNLSGEHMDYHGTMEDYFAAKRKLFQPGPKKKMAVINLDDRWGRRLMEEIRLGTVTFGFSPDALVRVEKAEFHEEGCDISVKYPAGRITVRSPLIGRPNVYNTLAALSTALMLKIPVPKIQEGIRLCTGVPGRFEKIGNSLGLKIFVDYAHTDNALENLLETARALGHQRIIVVFGAGGDRDKSKRARMGEAAGRLSDWAIITSDNPRTEDPMAIIAMIEEGIKSAGGGGYEIIPDRKEAIRKALHMARKGDIILIAGKGHEDYQILGGKVIHFDDREVVRDIIAGELG